MEACSSYYALCIDGLHSSPRQIWANLKADLPYETKPDNVEERFKRSLKRMNSYIVIVKIVQGNLALQKCTFSALAG